MPDGTGYIVNYRMFGRKISSFYHFSRYQQQNRHIYQGDDHAAVLGKVWFRNYEETAAENRKLFSKFIEAFEGGGYDAASNCSAVLSEWNRYHFEGCSPKEKGPLLPYS